MKEEKKKEGKGRWTGRKRGSEEEEGMKMRRDGGGKIRMRERRRWEEKKEVN